MIDRERVVHILNLKLNTGTKVNLEFIMFTIDLIYEITGQTVHVHQIVNSINSNPQVATNWIDEMINYLIQKYDIETETIRLDTMEVAMSRSANLDPSQTRRITKYK